MYQLIDNERINIVDEHNAGVHYAFLNNIQATYVNGVLTASYNYPTIEGTEWQGAINTTKNSSMLLRIDDNEPIELTVLDGQTEQELIFKETGTYSLHLYATCGCEHCKFEVTV